jgi:hypothetical protein
VTAPAITQVRPRSADIFDKLSPEMYREAYKRGVSFSAHLESIDPSPEYKDGLDAFGRLLQVANIRTVSLPEHGIWADTMEAFEANDQTRMLAPEWLARQWRKALYGRAPNTRALYQSSDQIPGSVINPIWFDQTPVVNNIAPAIPISAVIAMTIGIRGATYENFYLTDVTAQERLVRVNEAAEIPHVALTGSDHTIRLHKYGRVIERSYEAIRRMQIDLMSLHIAQLAAQTEADKVTAALAVIVSGDGNTNTSATSYNLTTLDTGAVAGTLTLKGWLAFKMKFVNPYMMTTALANNDVALQMMTLNVGSANIPLVNIGAQSGFGGFEAINPGLRDNVALGWTADAPSLKIVAIDKRFALVYLQEIGSDIQEVERWASRQVQNLVMSEVNGFASLNAANAAKVLNVNA